MEARKVLLWPLYAITLEFSSIKKAQPISPHRKAMKLMYAVPM
jgi:hypothetical protein